MSCVWVLALFFASASADRHEIMVSGWDEMPCDTTQETEETFVSSGTYSDPTYNSTHPTYEQNKIVLLSHGRIQYLDAFFERGAFCQVVEP